MNRIYKDGKLYYFDVATGRYLDPVTLEPLEEKKEEPKNEATSEPVVAEPKASKKSK